MAAAVGKGLLSLVKLFGPIAQGANLLMGDGDGAGGGAGAGGGEQVGFFQDLINPFDGSNPLLDGVKDGLALGADIINPFDGSNPLWDAITGGGEDNIGGGGTTKPPVVMPTCTMPAGDCYQKCQQNDDKMRSVCQQLTDSHIAKLKMLGCNGVTCNIPSMRKTCGKRTVAKAGHTLIKRGCGCH